MPSRAVVILGMHRSGTSVLARGLKSLGVFLGDDFLAAKPDNPTGYWEDKTIVDLNERLLAVFGLEWESVALIEDPQWQMPEVQTLREEAIGYLQTRFVQHPLWGFKDPRTIRLLPFWRSVFQRLGVDDRYVVSIRNPLSVAASLLKRQSMTPATSHTLSLVTVVPYLSEIAERPFVVVDYDLLLADPLSQLARIASVLSVPVPDASAAEVESFLRDFLDPGLRHNVSSRYDFDVIPVVSPLVREAYLRLRQLATGELAADAPAFWTAWSRIRKAVEALIDGRASSRRGTQFQFIDRSAFPGTGVRFFVVIGAQRTGSNLLREILNSNECIAMIGEILSPDPAPVHWDNFLHAQPPRSFPSPSPRETERFLDRYFEFVFHRVRNYWRDADKSRCTAIGVDLKYNQLRHLEPVGWDSGSPSFLLSYLKSRGAVFIHSTRRNIIHCSISAQIAAERNDWHDDEGAFLGRNYYIDVEKCLADAQALVRDRDCFLEAVRDCEVTESCYEDLIEEIGRAASDGEIPNTPGPLVDIAKALGVPFRFHSVGSLPPKDIPYSRLLSNREALSSAVKQSRFSAFAASL